MVRAADGGPMQSVAFFAALSTIAIAECLSVVFEESGNLSFRGPTTFRRSPRTRLAILCRHQLKRAADQRFEPLVVDPRQLDTDPTCRTDIRGPEEDLRFLLDQCLLNTGTRGQPYGDVAVVVVIVRKHREDAFRREERR